MTATVDHSRDHDLTLQGNQAARSRALTHLLEIPGLPTVSTWLIDATSNELAGLILSLADESPEQQRQKVQAWAEFFHFTVTEDVGKNLTTVAAAGLSEYGVHVRIWTQVRTAIKEVAA